MSGIASCCLKDKKETLLSLWEERCIKEVSSADKVSQLALRNSVPTYLEHLSEALATNRKMDVRSILAHERESTRVGEMHGADRADTKNYALTEVIFEYHILREVIFQVLETDEPLAPVPRDIILDSIEQAVNDAAVKFSDVHADIRQQFINTLTHDLKNPLTAASMYAQLISRRPDQADACATSANKIVGNLNRLEAMIDNLLDANRIRAGEALALQFTQCDLDAVIRAVVEEMAIMYGSRFSLDSKEPVEGYWSCDGMRRAVENLIENAVKYSAPDTPIAVSLRRGKKSVELTVHNQGAPIPKNEIPTLFQQYRRSKSAQEGTKSGWGLGLTLVKGVVDAHNGTARVESEKGKGTSFILQIPFAEAPNM